MLHDRNNLHPPAQQKQQDIVAQLRVYRQQLATWNKELEDIEQRLTAFQQRQQELQKQLDIWHRERDYLMGLREEEERKQQEWQHRQDGDS